MSWFKKTEQDFKDLIFQETKFLYQTNLNFSKEIQQLSEVLEKQEKLLAKWGTTLIELSNLSGKRIKILESQVNSMEKYLDNIKT